MRWAPLLQYLNAKKDETKNKVQLVCILQECKERRGDFRTFSNGFGGNSVGTTNKTL